jgi:hypothetical protein
MIMASGNVTAAYYTYGGDSFTLSEDEWWDKGYHPENYGYTPLGSSTLTETFYGTYNYYIVTAYSGYVALIDSVQGSNGDYLNTYISGNVLDYQNQWGAPDGVYAHVGESEYGPTGGGFIVLDATGFNLNSITVYATATPVPIPPSWILMCTALLSLVFRKNSILSSKGQIT